MYQCDRAIGGDHLRVTFHPDDHFPTQPTLRYRLPSSSTIGEFKEQTYPHPFRSSQGSVASPNNEKTIFYCKKTGKKKRPISIGIHKVGSHKECFYRLNTNFVYCFELLKE